MSTVGPERWQVVSPYLDRALADSGQLARAIEIYRRHLDQILAANPKPDDNLADAYDLSRLYRSMAALERRAGQAEVASSLDRRRLNLWQHWATKLPNNPFVVRQLALLDKDKIEAGIPPR